MSICKCRGFAVAMCKEAQTYAKVTYVSAKESATSPDSFVQDTPPYTDRNTLQHTPSHGYTLRNTATQNPQISAKRAQTIRNFTCQWVCTRTFWLLHFCTLACNIFTRLGFHMYRALLQKSPGRATLFFEKEKQVNTKNCKSSCQTNLTCVYTLMIESVG